MKVIEYKRNPDCVVGIGDKNKINEWREKIGKPNDWLILLDVHEFEDYDRIILEFKKGPKQIEKESKIKKNVTGITSRG